jgi:hypothetical protein
MIEHAVFSGCSSLSALIDSSWADVQKFITLRLFIGSESVNNRWKGKNLLYVCPVYSLTLFCQ